MNRSYPSNFAVSKTTIAILSLAAAAAAQAQTAPAASTPPKASEAQQLETVVVTGIRASQEKSLKVKRNADHHVDVISAEDIGKMPDKNVADSLARIPGVNVSNAVSGEGGFDESDRVGLRGTDPSLTQTLINGHSVANGDWFVLSQFGSAAGRSVSFALLPSSLVSQLVVSKAPEAAQVEGGTTGSVNIITRKPLDFSKSMTVEASIGAVHSQLAGKTDPQLSGLFAFKNEAKTFGALLQAFSEERHLRRDGVETLSYEQIKPGSAIALTNPDLAGVYYPRSIGTSLFQQERKRVGGLLELQLRPSQDVELGLSAFTSQMDAKNYNNNYLVMGNDILGQGSGQAPLPGYVIQQAGGIKTLVEAKFAPVAGKKYGEVDPISRPDSKASANFVNLDGKWRVNQALSLSGKLGSSKGQGETVSQNVFQLDSIGGGAAWKLKGADTAPEFNIGYNPSKNEGWQFGWIWGEQKMVVKDSESWGQVDGEYAFESGPLTLLKFGVRHAQHERDSGRIVGQGPQCSDGSSFDTDKYPNSYGCSDAKLSPKNPANIPAQGQFYPGNYGSGLGTGFPTQVAYFTPEQLASLAKFARRELPLRRDWTKEYKVEESTTAAYLQGHLEGKGWSSVLGLRAVRTQSSASYADAALASTPGADTSSAFGPFLPTTSDRSYTDFLPSASLKLDLSRELVARFSLARTMTRADYSALSGAVSLSRPSKAGDVGSGSGGNPYLDPVRSTNLDANLEWYFAPRAVASAGLFYMNMDSYIGLGSSTRKYQTEYRDADGKLLGTGLNDYLLTIPVNMKAKVKGLETAFEMPLFGNFGINANYTYTDAADEKGHALRGAAKHTFGIGGYFETESWSLRSNYAHRSEMYVGQDRGLDFNQQAGGVWSASLGYKLNENFSFSLDGQNLNDPVLKYYALNDQQPRSIYKNGRQFYLTARIKY
ncbi:TonB-dependent receptor [Paucibacter sp. KBW04]|uniref:TonB-dependent receptor n=1 Tax=Paucibacter sp. KBW04 TaxID=2153361 RepID=UPI000F572BD3|nr:TonB-dependent receptor [Paucibacter sp. KBW04]RQO61141.1 TonB-dependent receptor [Paucibacter sp. KBW04]